MQQYYEVAPMVVGGFHDRCVEGECPVCGDDGARGDQCDECGALMRHMNSTIPVQR